MYASGARLVGEAHLESDRAAQRRAELLRDAARHRPRGDAARLRVPDQPAVAPTRVEADLRQLRGLARAGLAADDHDRVRADRGRDLLRALGHGQLRRIGDRGAPLQARLEAGHRRLEVGGEPCPDGLGRARVPRPRDPAGELALVRGERMGEARAQRVGGGSHGTRGGRRQNAGFYAGGRARPARGSTARVPAGGAPRGMLRALTGPFPVAWNKE